MPAEAEQRAVMAVVEDLEGALVALRRELGEPAVVEPPQPERGEAADELFRALASPWHVHP